LPLPSSESVSASVSASVSFTVFVHGFDPHHDSDPDPAQTISLHQTALPQRRKCQPMYFVLAAQGAKTNNLQYSCNLNYKYVLRRNFMPGITIEDDIRWQKYRLIAKGKMILGKSA